VRRSRYPAASRFRTYLRPLESLSTSTTKNAQCCFGNVLLHARFLSHKPDSETSRPDSVFNPNSRWTSIESRFFMGTSLPQEISDIIIDEVAEEPEPVPRITTLRVCSLVSPAWAHRSQGHLFSKIEFNCEADLRKWRAKIGADGPSYHVTHLHLTKISIDQILSDIAPAGWHMSSFTNLRILHLVRVPLQHEKVRFTYGAVGSTVSHLLLERCMTDIHHLTSFLRPFTNLENLSLLDPRMPSGPNPGYPPEPLSARGKINLELRINMVHCGQSFVDGLLLLPVAIRTITFSGHKPRIAPWENAPVPCMTEINKLLAASRETLTHFRVPSCKFPSSSRAHSCL